MFNMTKGTFMRVPKELLEEIRKSKLVPRESYADVIERMIKKERGMKR